jgi:hypothetical protein
MVKWVLAGLLAVSVMSCSGGAEPAPEAPAAKTVTYKCLMSSCPASVTVKEGDPVPQHHEKPMMK